MNSIAIRQVNLNRSQTAFCHLIQSMQGKSSYVCILSEPNVYNKRVTNIPGDSECFPVQGHEKQRACILVNKELVATEISEFTTKDSVVVMIRTSGLDFLIVSFYCDIKEELKDHIIH